MEKDTPGRAESFEKGSKTRRNLASTWWTTRKRCECLEPTEPAYAGPHGPRQGFGFDSMIWVSSDLKLRSYMVTFASVKEHSDDVQKAD